MHETYAIRARVRADRRSLNRIWAGEEGNRVGSSEQLSNQRRFEIGEVADSLPSPSWKVRGPA